MQMRRGLAHPMFAGHEQLQVLYLQPEMRVELIEFANLQLLQPRPVFRGLVEHRHQGRMPHHPVTLVRRAGGHRMDLPDRRIDPGEAVEPALRDLDPRISSAGLGAGRRRRGPQLPQQRRARRRVERQQIVQQRASGAAKSCHQQGTVQRHVAYFGIACEVVGKTEIRENPGEHFPLQQPQSAGIVTAVTLQRRGEAPQALDVKVPRRQRRDPQFPRSDAPEVIDIDRAIHRPRPANETLSRQGRGAAAQATRRRDFFQDSHCFQDSRCAPPALRLVC